MKNLNQYISENFIDDAKDKLIKFKNNVAENISSFIISALILYSVKQECGLKNNVFSALGEFFAGDISLNDIVENNQFKKIIKRIASEEDVKELIKHKSDNDFEDRFRDLVSSKLTEEDGKIISSITERIF